MRQRTLLPLLVLRRTMAYYRADGVRITHDPYARGMAEKYGAPGQTDNEGFDPYGDSVGAGIYGGTVKRDDMGQVVIGEQYQNHNPRPGPVYSGGGYTPTAKRLSDAAALEAWLDAHPDLVNEFTTGGAQPLHNCGMSARNQDQVSLLVARGGDIEAIDTYGYTPLHRASLLGRDAVVARLTRHIAQRRARVRCLVVYATVKLKIAAIRARKRAWNPTAAGVSNLQSEFYTLAGTA